MSDRSLVGLVVGLFGIIVVTAGCAVVGPEALCPAVVLNKVTTPDQAFTAAWNDLVSRDPDFVKTISKQYWRSQMYLHRHGEFWIVEERMQGSGLGGGVTVRICASDGTISDTIVGQ